MKWEAHECHHDPWLCVSDIDSCHVNLMSQRYFSTRLLFKKHRFLERYTEYSEWKDISCGILLQDRGRFLFKNTAFLKDLQNFVNGKTLLVAFYYKIVVYYYNIVVQKKLLSRQRFTELGERREKSPTHNSKKPLHGLIHAQHQIQLINQIHMNMEVIVGA